MEPKIKEINQNILHCIKKLSTAYGANWQNDNIGGGGRVLYKEEW